MEVPSRILEGVLESDLDESVAGNGSLLEDLPHDRFLALRLVLFPHRADQLGHDGLGGVRGREVHTVSQSEVDQPVTEGLTPVERELRLTDFTAVAPVVAEVEGPVRCVAVETGTVDLELLVGQLDQAQGANGNGEVAGGGPIGRADEGNSHD